MMCFLCFLFFSVYLSSTPQRLRGDFAAYIDEKNNLYFILACLLFLWVVVVVVLRGEGVPVYPSSTSQYLRGDFAAYNDEENNSYFILACFLFLFCFWCVCVFFLCIHHPLYSIFAAIFLLTKTKNKSSYSCRDDVKTGT